MFGKKYQDGDFCPYIQDKCITARCKMWVRIQGQHPQTAEPIDAWDCAILWQPILLVKFSQEVRQAAAATESMRNETVAGLNGVRQLATAAIAKRIGGQS